MKQASRSVAHRGFSLIEMLVVMALMGILMAGLSLVFSRSGLLARAQTEQAAMQQALRVSQHEMSRFLRMAGSGGLPISWTVRVPDDFRPSALPVDYDTMGSFPDNGFAVSVRNNVEDGTTIPENPVAGEIEHFVIPGSDVLIVRGVFTTPVYYFGEQVSTEDWVDDSNGTIGGTSSGEAEIEIGSRVSQAFAQPLDPLVEKLEDYEDRGVAVAFLVRDLGNPNAYFVVEWDSDRTNDAFPRTACTGGGNGGAATPAIPEHWTDITQDARNDTECITVHVKLDTGTGEGNYGGDFANLSMGTNLQSNAGSIDVNLSPDANRAVLPIPKQIGSIGILEEFRFYVRAEWEIPGDRTSRLTPVLTRAEYVPGTEDLIETIDIVSNMLDLQISVGIETFSAIGSAGFANIQEDGSDVDEVLFNSSEDKVIDPSQLSHLSPQRWFNPDLDFHFLRLTTVAQAARASDRTWVPRLGVIEDVDRSASFDVDGVTYNYNNDRIYQRSYLQTVVEMRNLK